MRPFGDLGRRAGPPCEALSAISVPFAAHACGARQSSGNCRLMQRSGGGFVSEMKRGAGDQRAGVSAARCPWRSRVDAIRRSRQPDNAVTDSAGSRVDRVPHVLQRGPARIRPRAVPTPRSRNREPAAFGCSIETWSEQRAGRTESAWTCLRGRRRCTRKKARPRTDGLSGMPGRGRHVTACRRASR